MPVENEEHLSSPAALRHPSCSESTNRPSKRRKIACQPCRLKKIKCDAGRPSCSTCALGTVKCEYPDDGGKLTLEAATELILGRITQLQEGVDRCITTAQSSASHAKVSQDVTETSPNTDNHDCSTLFSSKEFTATETSKDFLHIPPYRTTADTILQWHIFQNRWPHLALVGILFEPGTEFASDDSFIVQGGIRPADEERVPSLVDNFLQNVHTKNPILDVEALVQRGRAVPAEGFGWDATSCLLLVACALGSIAIPFDQAVPWTPSETIGSTSPLPKTTTDLHQAESYFVLACRRLGTLKHTLLGAQCHFFAGVYLAYTLRPLLSWQYFQRASSMYQLYIRTKYFFVDISELPSRSDSRTSKQHRLEQCMYWSCFKTECEFRVELPLPLSDIAANHHPQIFPSPPTPAALEDPSSSSGPPDSGSEDTKLRLHARRLCNEEESWYYYLTEIAFRRIGNRIINTFFRVDPANWLNIEPLLDIALEFDTQVSAWSDNLPPPMRDWASASCIRAPALDENRPSSFVSRELSWATDNRLLEMRSWLYQPFLYWLIHRGSAELDHSTNPRVREVLSHMIRSGIECNITIIDVRSLRHRHHGLWYDLRSITSACLILLAIVKAGREDHIPGNVEAVWGTLSSSSSSEDFVIGGRIGNAMAQLKYWSVECPSLLKHRDIVYEVARDAIESWRARRVGSW